MPSDLIRGWRPVRVKKTRQNKNPEPRSDSIGTEKALGCRGIRIPGPPMKSPRPSLPMTGGCQCGAIRYEVASFPLLLYTCNCTDCQRQTGSAFALNMPVRFSDFRILQGEPHGWHHTSPNGTAVISRFCGRCGTQLYGERHGRPETVSLRAGTLDDASWLVPVAHCFTRSAQPSIAA